MANVLCLVCDLKTRRAHSEVHGVHVNLTWNRLSIGSILHVCVDVVEAGHLDVNFLLTALVD